jgi:hypothetical protein
MTRYSCIKNVFVFSQHMHSQFIRKCFEKDDFKIIFRIGLTGGNQCQKVSKVRNIALLYIDTVLSTFGHDRRTEYSIIV